MSFVHLVLPSPGPFPSTFTQKRFVEGYPTRCRRRDPGEDGPRVVSARPVRLPEITPDVDRPVPPLHVFTFPSQRQGRLRKSRGGRRLGVDLEVGVPCGRSRRPRDRSFTYTLCPSSLLSVPVHVSLFSPPLAHRLVGPPTSPSTLRRVSFHPRPSHRVRPLIIISLFRQSWSVSFLD